MTVDEAISYFGNQVRVAEVLELGKGSITVYKQKGGIPFKRQCDIEKISNGELKACREHDPDNPFFIGAH